MRTAVNIFTASPGAGSGAGSGSVVRFPTQSGGAVVVHIFTVHPEGEGGLQGARWGGERFRSGGPVLSVYSDNQSIIIGGIFVQISQLIAYGFFRYIARDILIAHSCPSAILDG